MKHTPGPWEIKRRIATNAESSIVARVPHEKHPKRVSTRLIACCDVGYNATGEIPLNKKFVEANARLIASAPDLLEACRMIIDSTDNAVLEKIIDEYNQVNNNSFGRQVVKSIEQAIAKAEGENNEG